jgi:NitT/TauT family transport system ATP-binding protein
MVDGTKVTAPPRDLGVVFQRDLLFDWRTILDNVLVTAEFERRQRRDYVNRARHLLAVFGLAGYEQRYPWELSGGMRQRVAICRSLLRRPRFLLMDEPFGALDAITRDELNEELQASWLDETMTVLFITHSIAEAVFLSDHVMVMARNPGRITGRFTIDLPRPRRLAVRDTAAFTGHTAAIRETMIRPGVAV